MKFTRSSRPRIYIAGDSLAVTRSSSYLPMAGWGQMLPLFLDAKVGVVNCARGRASSKSFYDRGRLEWILRDLRAGDYVLISFGRIDTRTTPGMHTAPFGSYQDYLRTYVDAVRLKQAHPVLVTPYEARHLDAHGNNKRTLGAYPVAMAEVARESFTPLIDLYTQSLVWWEELGPRGSEAVFVHRTADEEPLATMSRKDNTHLRAAGALECARFIARSLHQQQIVPSAWIRDLDRQRFSLAEMGWTDHDTYADRVRSRTAEPAVRPLGYLRSDQYVWREESGPHLLVVARAAERDSPGNNVTVELSSDLHPRRTLRPGAAVRLELTVKPGDEAREATGYLDTRPFRDIAEVIAVEGAEYARDEGVYRVRGNERKQVRATFDVRIHDDPARRVLEPGISAGIHPVDDGQELRSALLGHHRFRIAETELPPLRLALPNGPESLVDLLANAPIGARVTAVTAPRRGRLRLGTAGRAVYAPRPRSTGYDFFTCEVELPSGRRNEIPVWVYVGGLGPAPGVMPSSGTATDETAPLAGWNTCVFTGEFPWPEARLMLDAPVITQPRRGSEAGTHPLIVGTAPVGETRVVLTVDGSEYATVSVNAKGEWWCHAPRAWPDGGHVVSAVVFGPRGTSVPGETAFRVRGADVTAITPQLLAPRDGATVPTRVKFEGTVPTEMGISKVELQIEGETKPFRALTVNGTGRWWTSDSSLIAWKPGSYTVLVTGLAASGERTAPRHVSFTVG